MFQEKKNILTFSREKKKSKSQHFQKSLNILGREVICKKSQSILRIIIIWVENTDNIINIQLICSLKCHKEENIWTLKVLKSTFYHLSQNVTFISPNYDFI